MVACSPMAARCGVRWGIPAAEAAALLTAGPPAAGRASGGSRMEAFRLWPYDPHADREALEQLAEWCRQFAPSVSLLEPADEGRSAWDTLLLDISGCAHLFGGDGMLAQRVLAALVERGLTARVAVAETIGAAWAVAHAALLHVPCRPANLADATPLPQASPTERRSTMDARGTQCGNAADFPLTQHGRVPPPGPGWGVVAPGELRVWLRALPVEALRLPEQTTALLHQLGVERIEQLWRLPRAELAARLGSPLVRRIDEALAIHHELAVPAPLVETPQARWAFDYPTGRHEVLCGVLGRLATPLLEALRQQTHGVRQVECWLRCQPADFDPEHDQPAVDAPAGATPWQRRLVLLSLEFFQPTASPRHVVEMFGLRLAERPLPGAVVEMGIEVLASGPLESHQQRLFVDGPQRESPRHVAQLIDRLSGRLGRRNVLRPQLTPDAQPENAYRCRPWVEQKLPALQGTPRRTRKRRRPSPHAATATDRTVPDSAAVEAVEPLAAGAAADSRPLWLCPRPLAVQVWSVAPDGLPERVRYAGQEHAVAHAWGPERIETGWWRRRTIGRDYYQVETADGARWWLYRRHRDGRWFMHGWFG